MDQKPKIDPGWNDPPMLNYTAVNPPPKSRITNKRVAFPMSISTNSSCTTNSHNISSSNVPPIMPPFGVPSPPSISLPQSTKQIICQLLKVVEARELFSLTWEEGKFSDDCKSDIELLAKALVEQDKVTVKKMKDKLLLHSAELCQQWLNEIDV